jgi:hypothetical protein
VFSPRFAYPRLLAVVQAVPVEAEERWAAVVLLPGRAAARPQQWARPNRMARLAMAQTWVLVVLAKERPVAAARRASAVAQ